MIRCEHCGRFHRAEEKSCPFCSRTPTWAGRLAKSAAATLSAMVLVACYGPFPDSGKDETGLDDFDADGYTSDVDCNDEDAAIHPDAEEICDDKIDNDCDEAIDAADKDCAKP